MTPLDMMQSLDAGKRESVYFLYGEERFFVTEIITRLTSLLVTEDNQDFNLERFEAAKSTPADWLGAASTLSFMGGDKLVIVQGLDEVTLEDAGIKALLEYIENPAPGSCLVLTALKADRKRKLYKAITKIPGSVECAQPREQGLGKWLTGRAKLSGYTLSSAAAQMMVQRVGPRPGLLVSELEKVLTYAGKQKKVSEDDVSEMVGEIKMESAFALTDALKEKNAGRALTLLQNQLDHGEEALRILGSIVWQFRLIWEVKYHQSRKLPPQKIAQVMGQKPFAVDKALRYTRNFDDGQLRDGFRELLRADRELKSTGRDPAGIMESLILRLCSTRRS